MKTLIKKPELLVEDFVKSIDIKDCARFSDIYPKVGKYVSGYDRGLNSIVKEIEESFRPELFSMPTFAYQVSGEYSMIMSAVKNNHLEELDTILETMFCFKRAGADGIFTYFTPQILDALSNIS